MPGIVKTRILKTEPSFFGRPALTVVYAVAEALMDTSARRVEDVRRDVEAGGRRGCSYAVDKLKPPRDLGAKPGAQEEVWALTERLLTPHLAATPEPAEV